MTKTEQTNLTLEEFAYKHYGHIEEFAPYEILNIVSAYLEANKEAEQTKFLDECAMRAVKAAIA